GMIKLLLLSHKRIKYIFNGCIDILDERGPFQQVIKQVKYSSYDEGRTQVTYQYYQYQYQQEPNSLIFQETEPRIRRNDLFGNNVVDGHKSPVQCKRCYT